MVWLKLKPMAVPVVLENEKGTYYFSGYWDHLKVSYTNDTHTEIVWHAHGCITLHAGVFTTFSLARQYSTDNLAGFDTFQQDSINNTMKFLQQRGQLSSNSTMPRTVVFPPEFAGGLIIPS